jgi:hypothetical protein
MGISEIIGFAGMSGGDRGFFAVWKSRRRA